MISSDQKRLFHLTRTLPLTNTFNISVFSVEDRERIEEGMGLDKMVEVFQNSSIQGRN